MFATRQLIGLDLLRFAAALLVILHHFFFVIWAAGRVDIGYRSIGPFASSCWVGVEIFFVLSGFIIAYSAQHASASEFLRNRATRLYPGAFLCATITAAAMLLSHTAEPPVAMLKSWTRAVLLWYKGPYIDPSFWTLPIEIAFYLLIFLLLLGRRFHRLEALMAALGLLSTAAWTCVYAARFHLIAPERALRFTTFLDSSTLSARLMLNHGCFFAIGGLLWLCLFQRTTPQRVLMIALFSATGILEILEHGAMLRRFYAPVEVTSAPAVVVWIAAVAFLILSVRGNDAIAATVGRRGAGIARKLGLMTYPLYLVQQIVGYILIDRLHKSMPDLLAILLTVVILLCASFLISRYLEIPLQHWLRRILPGGRGKMTVPATTLP